MKRHRIVSLFTGGGGLDIGLERTGRFQVVACVEVVPAFAETLNRNRDAGRIGDKASLRIYSCDIRSLDPLTLLRDLELRPGDVDLLVGGPPCQSFSTTGKRRTVEDPRGELLWDYLRFVDILRPRYFLMENVRGLMSAAIRHRPIADRPENGGPPLADDELPGSVVKLFLSDLPEEYRVDCFEVNAVNYGAPQLRERVLFFGNREGAVVEFPQPTHGATAVDQFGLFQSAMRPFRTLADALEGLSDSDPVVLDFSPRKKRYLAMVPPGGNWRCLPPEIAKESMGKAYHAKGGRSGWWRRLSFDLPTPTLVTMPNHAGTSLCHPTETRALSIREYARIQEFPDEWEFCGTVQEQYAQVGNAVPVRLGEVAGEVLAKHLDGITTRATTDTPRFRVVYLQSHIRTRYWYKDGQKVVWSSSETDSRAAYGPPKTATRVKIVE